MMCYKKFFTLLALLLALAAPGWAAVTGSNGEVTIENLDDLKKVFSVAGAGYAFSGRSLDDGTKIEVINFSGDISLDKELLISDNITLRGNGHTLDAQNKCRVIEVCCSGISVTIDGFTLMNGNAGDNGGGISSSLGNTLTVKNCTFVNNKASKGGGILAEGLSQNEASVTVTHCRFENNTAGNLSEGGGGICVIGGTKLTVAHCTFTGNKAGDSTAGYGGGVSVYNATANVSNCTFTGNTAQHGGGGVRVENATANVSNCTFTGNTVQNGGGGIEVTDSTSTVNVFHCTFTGNMSGSDFHEVESKGTLNAVNTVFWDDGVQYIFNNGTLNLYHCAYGCAYGINAIGGTGTVG
ncbi:MAG: right-handed parallel beta-helix repeat-containing protein, partial [Fretibacterium sp.]|nr:right-handed parallel beta-helix repeat-containing protein [Fretibacterium sp.]